MMKIFRSLSCKTRRKPLQFLTVIFLISIAILILYLIWRSDEIDFYLDHNPHYIDINQNEVQKLKIITVTGQSYEAKFSHIKIYVCKSNKISKPSAVVWDNKLWQKVGDESKSKSTTIKAGLYLYSAYYDTRLCQNKSSEKHCFIRVLSMLDSEFIDTKYYCQIWMGNDLNKAIVVDAHLQEIWSNEWDPGTSNSNTVRIYKPYLLSCTLPKKFSNINVSTVFVSISVKPCANTTNLFQINVNSVAKNEADKEKQIRFGICVKPLDFDADLSSNLIEWLELNFILGATNVDVYTFRVHPNVSKVLQFYQNVRKNVRVIPMSLPGYQPNFPIERSQFLKRNVWQKRRNELIPYNDCLYRNLYHYDYIIPLDIDEILVPKVHNNWTQLFQHLRQKDADKMKFYASYSVRNAYFFELFSDGVTENSEKLYFLRHHHRSANFSDVNQSVKSFVSTDKTLTVFNHYALDAVLAGVGRSTALPVQLIQMNHYRKTCPPIMSQECKNNFLRYKVADDILMRFKKPLEQKINDVLTKLQF